MFCFITFPPSSSSSSSPSSSSSSSPSSSVFSFFCFGSSFFHFLFVFLGSFISMGGGRGEASMVGPFGEGVGGRQSMAVTRMRRGEQMLLDGGETLVDKGKDLLMKEGEMVLGVLERGGEEVGEEVGEMVERIVEGKMTGWGKSFGLAVTLYFLAAWTVVFCCLLFWSDASWVVLGGCCVMWPFVLGGGYFGVYGYPRGVYRPSAFVLWHWGLFSSVFWLCVLLCVHHHRFLFSFLWKLFCLLVLLPPYYLLYYRLSSFSSFLFAFFLSFLLSMGMGLLFGLFLVSPSLWWVWLWPFLLWCFLTFMMGKIFF